MQIVLRAVLVVTRIFISSCNCLSVYPVFLTAFAVSRNSNAIPLRFSIDLVAIAYYKKMIWWRHDEAKTSSHIIYHK